MANKRIDNLNFNVILQDEEFERRIRADINLAKKFNIQVSQMLEFSNKMTGITAGQARVLSQQRQMQESQKRMANQTALNNQRIATEAQRTAAATDRAAKAHLSLVNAQNRSASSQEYLANSIRRTNSEFTLQSRLISNARTLFTSYISVFAVSNFISSLARIRGEFELQQVALRAIMQDVEAADRTFNQIKDLAIESPFKFKELTQYAKMLSAYNIANEDLFATTKQLADLSAGLGVGMDRIILAYGQVRSAEFLRGQEVRQFSEAGINLVGALADKFGELEGRVVSAGEVFDRISNRMVTFEMVKDVIDDLTLEGGRFFDQQRIQAETLYGMIQKLADNYEIMLNDIGQANEGMLKGGVGLLISLTNNWEAVLGVLKGVIIAYGSYKAASMVNTQLIGKENKELIDSILLSKSKNAATLKQVAAYRALTVEEVHQIETAGRLTAADLRAAVANKEITQNMLLRMVATKKLSQEQALLLASSLNLTKAEIARAAGMSKWQVAMLSLRGAAGRLTTSLRALWATMISNPVGIVLAAVGALVSLFTKISDHNKKVLRDSARTKEYLTSFYNEISKSYEAARKTIDQGLSLKVETKGVSDAIELLKNLTKDSDLLSSLLLTGVSENMTQNEQLRIMKENWDQIYAGIKRAKDSLVNMADINNNTGGPLWNDSFSENVQDLSGSIEKVRKKIAELKTEGEDVAKIEAIFKDWDEGTKDLRSTTEMLARTLFYAKKEGFGGLVTQLQKTSRHLAALNEDWEDFRKQIANVFPEIDWSKATTEEKAQLSTMYKNWVSTFDDMDEQAKKILDGIFKTTYHLQVDVNLGGGEDNKLSALQKEVDKILNGRPFELKPQSDENVLSYADKLISRYQELQKSIKANENAFKGTGNRTFSDMAEKSRNKLNILIELAKKLNINLDGDKKDPWAEKLQNRIDLILKAQKQYEEYIQYMNSADAMEKIRSDAQFTDLDFEFDPSVVETQLRKIYSQLGSSEEANKIKEKMREIFTDIDFEGVKNRFEQFLNSIAAEVDRYAENYNFYQKLLGLGVSRDDAVKLSFGTDFDSSQIKGVTDSIASGINAILGEIRLDPIDLSKITTTSTFEEVFGNLEGQPEEAIKKLRELFATLRDTIRQDTISLQEFKNEIDKLTQSDTVLEHIFGEEEFKKAAAIMARDYSTALLKADQERKERIEKLSHLQKSLSAEEYEQKQRNIGLLYDAEVSAAKRATQEKTESLVQAYIKDNTEVDVFGDLARLSAEQIAQAMKGLKNIVRDKGLDLGELLSEKELDALTEAEVGLGKIKKDIEATTKAKRKMLRIEAFNEMSKKLSETLAFVHMFRDGVEEAFGEDLEDTELIDAIDACLGMLEGAIQGFAATGGNIAGAVVGGIMSLFGSIGQIIRKNKEEALRAVVETQKLINDLNLIEVERSREGMDTIFGDIKWDNVVKGVQTAKRAMDDYKKSILDWKRINLDGPIATVLGIKPKYVLQGNDVFKTWQFRGQELQKAYDLWDENGVLDPDKVDAFLELEDIPEDLRNGLEYSSELVRQYQEAMQQVADGLSEIFGGLADSITDSIFDAFQNGTDALDAFSADLKDAVIEWVKQMAQLAYITPVLEGIQGQIEEAVSSGDMDKVNAALEGGLQTLLDKFPEWEEQLSNYYAQVGDKFEDMLGIDISQPSDESGGLAGGIKGVTEDTAQLLASYLNAMRQEMLLQGVSIRNIEAAVVPSRDIAMQHLTSLHNIEAYTLNTWAATEATSRTAADTLVIARDTLTTLQGVITDGHPKGGAGLKVWA